MHRLLDKRIQRLANDRRNIDLGKYLNGEYVFIN
jgi:hypothetical protein